MRKLMFIPVGPSGAGKTTLGKELEKIGYTVVSFDRWRVEDFLAANPFYRDLPYNAVYERAFKWYRENRIELLNEWKRRAKKIINKSSFVYVDNTNLKKEHRAEFISWGKENGYAVVAILLLPEIKELVHRDRERSRNGREKSVGLDAIKWQVETLEKPELSEGFDAVFCNVPDWFILSVAKNAVEGGEK